MSSSSLVIPEKELWIKYGNKPAFPVPTHGCHLVAHLIVATKREFQLPRPVYDYSLSLAPDGPALEPDAPIPVHSTFKDPLIIDILPHQVEEIDPKSTGHPELRRLISKIQNYLFRTDNWCCVTVLDKRSAVTFAHCPHDALAVGDRFHIHSVAHENVKHEVVVVAIKSKCDWILLKSVDTDLCDEAPELSQGVMGDSYIQLGLSALQQLKSPFSVSRGIISSQYLSEWGHLLGSAGSNPGDSGGGCFHEASGHLIGISVGCERSHIDVMNETGSQIFDKMSTRFASRAHIVHVASFLSDK